MKKSFYVVAALSLAMSCLFAGCGKSADADNTAVESGNASSNASDADSINPAVINPDEYITSLGEYKGITVAVEKTEVTDASVDDYIMTAVNNTTTNVEVTDRDTVEVGDVANIDYVGKKDDVAFDGGTAEGYDLEIGSGQFIPGFEDGLVGAKVGETVDLDLSFPEEYHNEELAGQAVVFTVTVNSISQKVPAELNDEFVVGRNIEGVTTVDEFKAYIRDMLEKRADDEYEANLKEAAIDQIVAATVFTDGMPEGLYQYYYDMRKSNDEYYASQYGFSLADYASIAYSMDEETYEQSVKDSAAAFVHETMVCNKIAQLENITVSDDEYSESLAKDAASVGYTPEDYETFINVDQYKFYILENKVIDFIMANSQK